MTEVIFFLKILFQMHKDEYINGWSLLQCWHREKNKHLLDRGFLHYLNSSCNATLNQDH